MKHVPTMTNKIAEIEVRGCMYDVEHFTRIRRSGYETLCLETTLHLMENGWISTVNHEPDHEVIGLRGQYIDNEFRPAFICFERRPLQRLAHVIIGGVAHDNRKQGFYVPLFECLAGLLMQDPAIKSITGCYHVDNLASARMNEKIGRKAIRVTTEFPLD